MRNLFKFIGLAFLTITLGFTNVDKRTIVIDAGHGGKDAGAHFENFNEKIIALEIAKKIVELNENSNIEIVLTRDSDKFVSIDDRTEFINALKPEFVISIHVNFKNVENFSGKDIYISDNNKEKEKSLGLALRIEDAFQNKNIETKKANFNLLKNVNYPIALLEVGYLSNTNDRAQLTSEEGQAEIAKAILDVMK